MKKFIFTGIAIVALAISSLFAFRSDVPPEKAIADRLIVQVDSFYALRNQMLKQAKGNAGPAQLQRTFLTLRLAYKRFEWASEYFLPTTARFINGPPVQEVETSNEQVFEPAGLQVIEGFLFPRYNPAKKKALIAQLELLQNTCDKLKAHFTHIDIFDWQVFDATKQEVFRVLCLGIAGFDNPLTLKSSQEAVASLSGLQQVLSYYADKVGNNTLAHDIIAADAYLQKHTDFNRFNRAEFITSYGNPITIEISNLEDQLKPKITTYNRLLNQNARTLFDKDAYNPNAYAPGDSTTFATPQKTALGRALFADPILSGNGMRSCQSCHKPELAFTDGLVKNTLITGKGLVQRNTPTLINAALQASQFDDMRAATLEDQAIGVVQNKDEMHGDMTVATKKLWKDADYRRLFADAFPIKNRTEIDTSEVMNALGSYIRSLTALNSRFDEYMRGNKSALNADEIMGFNLFTGKARCGTCHYMPLFNGSFPPRYTKVESEVIGVPKTAAMKVIDDDMGRYNILKVKAFKHAFKIPGIRNVALTAPYMHNGVFKTLDEVMNFYNKGGGAGLGFDIDNQTLSAGKLNLTPTESKQLIAFMKALNSK